MIIATILTTKYTQRAAQALFDDEASTTAQPVASSSRGNASTSRTVEQMSIDDSLQQSPTTPTPLSRRAPGSRRNPAPAYPTANTKWNALSIISFPFTLLGGLLNFVFRILRFPLNTLFPYLLRGGGGGGPTLRPGAGAGGGLGIFGGGSKAIQEDPDVVAERFVRELEDETGALTVSHARAANIDSSDAPSSSTGNGNSSENNTHNSKLLPDFFIGSYEQALKAAQTDLRVLCAIVLSSEHDDVPEFRR